MDILLMLTILLLWAFSVFTFTEWRVRLSLQNGTKTFNALNDWATSLFVKTTAIFILLIVLM